MFWENWSVRGEPVCSEKTGTNQRQLEFLGKPRHAGEEPANSSRKEPNRDLNRRHPLCPGGFTGRLLVFFPLFSPLTSCCFSRSTNTDVLFPSNWQIRGHRLEMPHFFLTTRLSGPPSPSRTRIQSRSGRFRVCEHLLNVGGFFPQSRSAAGCSAFFPPAVVLGAGSSHSV